MLFNTPSYLFAFLPVCALLFYTLNLTSWRKQNVTLLLTASIVFYTIWNPLHLILLAASIIANYFISKKISPSSTTHTGDFQFRKPFLIVGIAINLAPLAFFKYSQFIIENGNHLFETNFSLEKLALPLAISFFSFQQISYLVDCYHGEIPENSLKNYALYVSFFPQLIAGPIVRHQELSPQLSSIGNWATPFYRIKFGSGITLIAIGLFKKTVLADQIGSVVDIGYSMADSLNFLESWLTSIGFTLQIYYDFSGYTDIAIGSALLFGITLPQNFNSPYKSRNVRQFWKCWHITLSNWFLDYVYKPLGGNRKTYIFVAVNILVTFVLSGLWHGAGWNFIIWGLIHGIALLCLRAFGKLNLKIPTLISWTITFAFINASWVVFRAPDLTTALKVLNSLKNLEPLTLSPNFTKLLAQAGEFSLFAPNNQLPTASIVPYELLLCIGLLIIPFKNSNSIASLPNKNSPSAALCILIGLIAGLSVAILLSSKGSNFIYFNF